LCLCCWDLAGLGNGPNILLCSHAAPRSARCSKDAAPLSRSIRNQDRIVARVRRGGHIRPGLAVFRPRYNSCHCRGRRCGRCRGNHQIAPLFRTRAALGSASANLRARAATRKAEDDALGRPGRGNLCRCKSLVQVIPKSGWPSLIRMGRARVIRWPETVVWRKQF